MGISGVFVCTGIETTGETMSEPIDRITMTPDELLDADMENADFLVDEDQDERHSTAWWDES